MAARILADRRLRWWARGAFFMALAGGLALPVATVAAHEPRRAPDPPASSAQSRGIEVPRVLSRDDDERYVRIFALQEKGDWHAADHQIGKLDDRILMGHVMAQRYLHPTHYRSKFRELKAWLADYADHPQATRIYRLAMRRKPNSARAPRRPVTPEQPGVAAGDASPKPVYISPRKRSAAQRRKLVNLIAHMRGHLRRGQPTAAAKHLSKKDFRSLADDVEFDTLRREIGHAYFLKGDDDTAFELASAAARRSGGTVPLAHWTAGLAAFRLGDLGAAQHHFEAVATSRNAAGRTIAGGAYWAARVNLIARRPERVSQMLRRAAAHPRTFYGLLAHGALGEAPPFSWGLPPLDESDMSAVFELPAARRALALTEVGRNRGAELELRRLRSDGAPALGAAMLALAERLELPSAQLRIARGLEALDGRRYDGAMYPVPRWQPRNGFVVDRALVFALMRQESQFSTRAKSRAGARGLMQLMPRTAAFVARDRRYRTSRRNDLFTPEINIDLGQRYILHLLKQPEVEGNLMYLVAAYNGGPGNLKKWRRRNDLDGDALLFVEALPSRETREFVERVLANLWIYRARLGQAAPSLDDVASGRWPLYAPQDGGAVAEEGHAGN